MRVYSYKDRIEKGPLIINGEFDYAAFSCELACGPTAMAYLTDVAKSTYAHYIEAFRITDVCANKRIGLAVITDKDNARCLMCGTMWLSNELVKFTKMNPQYKSIWTTTRSLIAPRANHIAYYRASKLLKRAQTAVLDAATNGQDLRFATIKDVAVANLTEYYEFDENEWQIPVKYTDKVVVNADGRKHHGEPKGRGAAIYSSDTTSFLYLPKNKEPFRIKRNSITGENVLDCQTLPGVNPKTYYGYVTRRGEHLYFHVIHESLEFFRFTRNSYFMWDEPQIQRQFLHKGIYAHTENGVIVPNDRIPDRYRSRCGLE